MAIITPDSAIPGTRLLVVEGEPAIQDMLAMSLAVVGYAVLRAGSGSEAVAHADKGRIELVLLDMVLPDTDGFALMRRLRKVHPDMAAVFVTAKDALEDRLAGLTLGGDDYITKPFSLEEVVTRVGVVLRRTYPVDSTTDTNRLTYADLVLDEDRHEVHRNNRSITLSPTMTIDEQQPPAANSRPAGVRVGRPSSPTSIRSEDLLPRRSDITMRPPSPREFRASVEHATC